MTSTNLPLQVKQLEQLFGKQENIRLVSVIAHVDHGKTTLTDSLLARAGIIDQEQAGSRRGTDTMEEEKARGITIRSTGVTMTFDGILKNGEECVLHLVDCPGYDYISHLTPLFSHTTTFFPSHHLFFPLTPPLFSPHTTSFFPHTTSFFPVPHSPLLLFISFVQAR
jgi:Elongation factor Tu GTP binding domain